MSEDVDWRYRADHIAKHGVTPELTAEALDDPNRMVLDPDPASLSGRTLRIVGWRRSQHRLITVIVSPDGDVTWGVNAWPSNSTDQHRYRKGIDDEH